MCAKAAINAITPTRQEDYPEWYQQVVRAADLAELSGVRGCMIIKPWGYALWENIQKALDEKIKATGHRNVYFPLFVPVSYLEREAKHVEGFAKECAVVTHHRLELGADGRLHPKGELEEPLVVRPTSEAIIGQAFSRWIESYRDLPILINQWANVVRWEMRTRLFLRTTEFLWQEGHTAHATKEEALEESAKMLGVYADFAENYLAIPFIVGEKTETERFPGADITYTIEAMMQDRKALQGGTSHFLGQNFSKGFDITFRDPQGDCAHPWTTSWGVTTRLIGALVMVHGDDNGVILPPRIAPAHIVILPVIHKEETTAQVLEYVERLANELKGQEYYGQKVRVEVDAREGRGGDKVWTWIKQGVPLILEIGPRDIQEDSVFVGRRDWGRDKRYGQKREEFIQKLGETLDDMHRGLFNKALEHRTANTVKIDTKDEFYAFFTPKNAEKPEIHGGFALCHWSGDPAVEAQVQKDLGVTIRCIPLDAQEEEGTCVISGKPSRRRVIFAKSY